MRIGIALLGGLPAPVHGFSGVIRHDADVSCGAIDRAGRNRKTSQDSHPGVLEVRLISENALSSLTAQGFLEADCVTGSAEIESVLGKAV